MGALMLVHGVAHGSWCWSRAKAGLVDRGHDVFAVDLSLSGLEDDAAVVRAALDDWGRDVVLVGWSYGGLVISRAAAWRDDVHSPFLSRPDRFVDLLDAVACKASA
jgi:pimeloyl-ACP methyl ester carboxylesterase